MFKKNALQKKNKKNSQQMPPPHQSLISKLRHYAAKKKNNNNKTYVNATSLDDDTIRKIAVKMPRTNQELASMLNAEQFSVHGEQLLIITQDHKRDQAAFEDCAAEIGAFAGGGPYAMDRLDKVYRRILAHFKMMPDMDDVFAAKRLYVSHKTQKVAQWGAKTDEAEFSTPPF